MQDTVAGTGPALSYYFAGQPHQRRKSEKSCHFIAGSQNNGIVLMPLKQRPHPGKCALPETEERHRPQQRVIVLRRQRGRRTRKPGVTVNEKMKVVGARLQNISSEGQELADMLRSGRCMAGVCSTMSWKRSSSRSCSANIPNSEGTGASGSSSESTWLTPTSHCPASSAKPQTVILIGKVAGTFLATRLAEQSSCGCRSASASPHI
jgi:hypothetical protein